jgi:transposase
MQKQNDVLALVRAKISFREIEERLGIRRETASKYAQSAGLWTPPAKPATAPEVATGSEIKTGHESSPRPPDGTASVSESTLAKIPAHARSACEPHREWIEAQIRLGRNAMAIYQELVDRYDFKHQYNSVKRFVRCLKRREPEQFDRLEFLPGEEAQVDYGQGAPTRCPKTGKMRRPRLFVMTLRYSRRSFRKVVWNSSQEVWARLHEEAFRYFGGCPRYVVLDNLKEGVLKPDIYEPLLNHVYGAMLNHYDVVADPARVEDPDRKGSVENAINHTQETPLKGKTFESIEEQNAFLMHWEEKWAAPRVHGRAKRQVQAMFEEEKPFLKPLALMPFRYFKQESRTVWDDGLIQVGQCYYAALPAPLFSQVWVRIYDLEIEVLDQKTMTVLRRHRRKERPGDIAFEPGDRIFNPSRETERLLKQAEAIGPWAAKMCHELFKENGRIGQKKIQGIVALTRKHSASRIESACKAAFERHAWSSRSVRLLIEARIEQEQADEAAKPKQLELLQSHESIRPISEYQDFWEKHAQSNGGDDVTAKHAAQKEGNSVCPCP